VSHVADHEADEGDAASSAAHAAQRAEYAVHARCYKKKAGKGLQCVQSPNVALHICRQPKPLKVAAGTCHACCDEGKHENTARAVVDDVEFLVQSVTICHCGKGALMCAFTSGDRCEDATHKLRQELLMAARFG